MHVEVPPEHCVIGLWHGSMSRDSTGGVKKQRVSFAELQMNTNTESLPADSMNSQKL